jgi:hypothetical protein
LLARRKVDQRQAEFRPLPAAQVRRRFDQRHFKRRLNRAFEKVTAAGSNRP